MTKQFFVIYNPEKDKFLLDETDPELHRPYRWVVGTSGCSILAITGDMLDGFIAREFETANHILEFLKNHCPDDGIMLIPMNMINEDRATFDFKHGFKL